MKFRRQLSLVHATTRTMRLASLVLVAFLFTGAAVSTSGCNWVDQENAPLAPRQGPDVDVEAVSDTAIRVSVGGVYWEPLEIHILRMADDESAFTELKVVYWAGRGQTTIEWLDEGLKPSTRYFYKGYLLEGDRQGEMSTVAEVDTLAPRPQAVWNTATMTLCKTKATEVPNCGMPDGSINLAFDSKGQGHAAFMMKGVRYARYTGNDWLVETPPTPSVQVLEDCAIAVDSQDRPHIVYVGKTNDWRKHFGHAWLEGGEWKDEKVETVRGAGGQMAMAIDSQDRIHVVFASGEPTTGDLLPGLYYNRQGPDGWVESLIPQGDLHSDSRIGMAVDSKGRPHVVCIAPEALQHHTWKDDDAPWATDQVDFKSSRDPDIAVDALDGLHIAYERADTDEMVHAYRPAGESKWIQKTVFDGTGWNRAHTRIAADSKGRVHIAHGSGYAVLEDDQWTLEPLPHGRETIQMALAIDPSGRPNLLYHGEPLGSLEPGPGGTTYTTSQHLPIHAVREEGFQPLEDVMMGLSDSNTLDDCAFLETDSEGRIHIVGAAFYRLVVGDLFYRYWLPDGVPQVSDFPEAAGAQAPPWPIALYHDEDMYRFDGQDWTFMDLRKNPLEADGSDLADGGGGWVVDSGPDGMPHVFYFDSNNRPRHAWQPVILELEHEAVSDTPGGSGSIVAAPDGSLHVAWIGLDGDGIFYASKNPGAGWKQETVDRPDVERFAGTTDLALDPKGRPGIVYSPCVHPEPGYCGSPDSLRLARRIDGTWTKETVDGRAETGEFASLTFGPNDAPHITWHDPTLWGLRYGHWEKDRWVIEDLNTYALNGNRQYAGRLSDVVASPDGRVRIFRGLSGKDGYADIPASLYMGLRR
jgi:hypothetical protein